MAGGIAIKYKDTTGGVNVIKMMVDSGGNRKPGQIWIASMQKVRFSNIQGLYDQAPPSTKSSNDSYLFSTQVGKRRGQYSISRIVIVGPGQWQGVYFGWYTLTFLSSN